MRLQLMDAGRDSWFLEYRFQAHRADPIVVLGNFLEIRPYYPLPRGY
jgi:hypothetical protein